LEKAFLANTPAVEAVVTLKTVFEITSLIIANHFFDPMITDNQTFYQVLLLPNYHNPA
jgi:hypothetical protein